MSFFHSPISTSSSASTTSSSSSIFQLEDLQTETEGFSKELQIIHTWFSILNDEERTAALNSIAEIPMLREIEPLIQTLKDHKRELWRRQEQLLVQTGEKKWPIPPFPRDSRDPRWLPKWLRALRLHKYEKCLAGLSPMQVSQLSEEDLQELGVDTVGARSKMLRAIHAA